MTQEVNKTSDQDTVSKTTAFFNVSNNMTTGTKGDIIFGTVLCGNKVFIALTKEFQLCPNDYLVDKILLRTIEGLGTHVGDCKLDIEIISCGDAVTVVKEMFNQIHLLKPDFIVTWNLKFEMEEIIRCLDDAEVSSIDVICGPAVDDEPQFLIFHKGATFHTTPAGNRPTHPGARKVCVQYSGKGEFINGFGRYYSQNKKLETYVLERVVREELGIAENFGPTEYAHLRGLEWHQTMQHLAISEYIAYDVVSLFKLQLLEQKCHLTEG